ncbi:MAG: outer membrane lipoprotein-sorting protein, partial [Candidatus Marinimicrobia bacterium]|nr:outer membrane lipoprotein-sorting protein [Candidatus Neomarinimicrobiota bacterium]
MIIMFSCFSAGGTVATAQDARELLERVDRLYRSNSSYSKIEMEVITENWERTMQMEVWTSGMEKTLIKLLAP